MGRFSGFIVTLRQMCKPRAHHRVPEGEARQARAPARPPRPQPLRGRDGEVHRLRAVRGRVPGALHLRARRRQPGRRPGLAGRALRLRLRDQLPAVHPLRPLRRGVPDRGDHRDEAVRVLVHEPRRRDLHQGASCSSTTTAAPSGCRGSCGPAARTTTPARGCAPRRRAVRAAYEGRVGWSGELGFGVRPPEQGQSDLVPSHVEPPPTSTSRVRATDAVAHLLRLRGGRAHRRARRRARAQSRALGAVPAAHARERRGAVPAARRRARRRPSRSSCTRARSSCCSCS